MGGRDLDDIVDGARYLVHERGIGEKKIGLTVDPTAASPH
jgi:hypothetical protein